MSFSEGNVDVLSNTSASVHVLKDSSKWIELSKKIQKEPPLFKDRGLVLLLRQLVVDVLILNGLV